MEIEYKIAMSEEDFIKLQMRTEKDTTIDADNVEEKVLALSRLYTRYNRRYHGQLRILKNINTTKIKLYRKLYHYYKFDADFRLDTKKEIEAYVYGDDAYGELRVEYDQQTRVVDFLEKTLGNIQRASFTIRDYIELQKFKKGIV